MKTTLDLPVELVREMERRAAREGRKLQEVAAEILRRGLSGPGQRGETAGHRVKLPLIPCGAPLDPAAEPDAEAVAALLLEQEVEWMHEAAGH